MILHVSPNLGILFLEYVWTEIISLESVIGGLSDFSGAITDSLNVSGLITTGISQTSNIEDSIDGTGNITPGIALNSRIL